MDSFLILMVIILVLAIALLFLVISYVIPGKQDVYERNVSSDIQKIKEQYI